MYTYFVITDILIDDSSEAKESDNNSNGSNIGDKIAMTNPEYHKLFDNFGFHPIGSYDSAENKSNEISNSSLHYYAAKYSEFSKQGCDESKRKNVIMNCLSFLHKSCEKYTYGANRKRYLLAKASINFIIRICKNYFNESLNGEKWSNVAFVLLLLNCVIILQSEIGLKQYEKKSVIDRHFRLYAIFVYVSQSIKLYYQFIDTLRSVSSNSYSQRDKDAFDCFESVFDIRCSYRKSLQNYINNNENVHFYKKTNIDENIIRKLTGMFESNVNSGLFQLNKSYASMIARNVNKVRNGIEANTTNLGLETTWHHGVENNCVCHIKTSNGKSWFTFNMLGLSNNNSNSNKNENKNDVNQSINDKYKFTDEEIQDNMDEFWSFKLGVQVSTCRNVLVVGIVIGFFDQDTIENLSITNDIRAVLCACSHFSSRMISNVNVYEKKSEKNDYSRCTRDRAFWIIDYGIKEMLNGVYDTFLLYWSSHGAKGKIYCSDTAVHKRDIYAKLDVLPTTKKKVIIFDSCNGGDTNIPCIEKTKVNIENRHTFNVVNSQEDDKKCETIYGFGISLYTTAWVGVVENYFGMLDGFGIPIKQCCVDGVKPILDIIASKTGAKLHVPITDTESKDTQVIVSQKFIQNFTKWLNQLSQK